MRHLIVDNRSLAASALAEVVRAVDLEAEVEVSLNADSALERAAEFEPDVAFLDIEMPGTNGIELARQLQREDSAVNIVFVTGHPDYALEAHSLYVSGFLVKPVTEADVALALRNLRHPVTSGNEGRLRVQCFGSFEVFSQGRPLAFERSKTKELLAYLVDRRGAQVSSSELVAVLWEGAPAGSSKGAQLRNLIHDLRAALEAAGIADVLVRRHGSVGVNCDRLDCDYYRYLAGDPALDDAFMGEYMAQYSWAEPTCGLLQQRTR